MDVFYPRRCAVCDRVLTVGKQYLCRECVGTLPYIEGAYCMKCGKPVEEGKEYCMDCAGKERRFICGRAVFLYDDRMRESMSRFKYHARREYAEFFGMVLYQCFGNWIENISPDALIPVPVHRERYRKRGYNQAELLALELGKRCGVQVLTDYLVRTKNTLPQKELSDKERFANLCCAFSVSKKAQELYKKLKCVIIIDDIYTTGNTISACSQILGEQGIRSIYFLCVCIGKGF